MPKVAGFKDTTLRLPEAQYTALKEAIEGRGEMFPDFLRRAIVREAKKLGLTFTVEDLLPNKRGGLRLPKRVQQALDDAGIKIE